MVAPTRNLCGCRPPAALRCSRLRPGSPVTYMSSSLEKLYIPSLPTYRVTGTHFTMVQMAWLFFAANKALDYDHLALLEMVGGQIPNHHWIPCPLQVALHKQRGQGSKIREVKMQQQRNQCLRNSML